MKFYNKPAPDIDFITKAVLAGKLIEPHSWRTSYSLFFFGTASNHNYQKVDIDIFQICARRSLKGLKLAVMQVRQEL